MLRSPNKPNTPVDKTLDLMPDFTKSQNDSLVIHREDKIIKLCETILRKAKSQEIISAAEKIIEIVKEDIPPLEKDCSNVMTAINGMAEQIKRIEEKLSAPHSPWIKPNLEKESKEKDEGEMDRRFPPLPPSRHAVIVSHKEEKDSAEVMKAVKKSLDPRKLKVGITNIRQSSNGRAVISCEKKQDAEIIMKALSSETVSATCAKKRNPKIILKGVQKELNSADIIETMGEQNEDLADLKEESKILFFQKNKNPHLTNVVIETSPKTWKKIIGMGRINIGFQRIHAENFISTMQCMNCLGFGHLKKHCEMETRCWHCAGKHTFAQCQNKDKADEVKCGSCVNENRKRKTSAPSRHRSGTHECPLFRKEIERSIDHTNYE